MARKVAEEHRTIRTVADDDSDVPEALRLIADELEGGGELIDISVGSAEQDGSHDPGFNPDEVEDPAERARMEAENAAPRRGRRRNIHIEARIRAEITR